MTSRQITALRFVSLAIVALVLLLNIDLTAKESVNRPPAEGVAALTEAHGCSSVVPDPTHAVVTGRDGVTRYVGQAGTDRAIEQSMYGIDHGLTVHTFCP